TSCRRVSFSSSRAARMECSSKRATEESRLSLERPRIRIRRGHSCDGRSELRRGDGFGVQKSAGAGYGADLQELIGLENIGNAELQIIGGEGRRPGSRRKLFRAI